MNRFLKDLEFTVFTSPIEKTGHTGDARLIRGYASVGDVLDRQNEVITLGALVKAREDLLKNHTIFYEHKHSELPIGKTIAVDIDEKGLLITVEISKGSHADGIWTLIQEGILNSFSIGGRVLEAEEVRDEKGNLFNEITRIELFETSVVGLPANPAARFELVSKGFTKTITEEMTKRRNSDMSEKKDEVKKEEVKEIDVKLEVKDTNSTEAVELRDTEGTKEAVTKSEETKTEKSEEVAEEKVEKKEEKKEEAPVEKETVAKSEEAKPEVKKEEAKPEAKEDIKKSEETRDERKARLLKEIEDIDAEEAVEKETASDEGSDEEELPEEKSYDQQILETLVQLVEKLDKRTEEKVEVTEKAEEAPAEEVKEEAPAEKEELAVAKSEKTSEKAEDKDLEKVVKVEAKEEKKEEVIEKKETPTRKGEVILATQPYAEGDETPKVDEKLLKKIKDLKWCQYIYGNK